jgi:hypothetical protein
MDDLFNGIQPDNHLGGVVKNNLILVATTLLLAGCAGEATAPVVRESNATPRASTSTSTLLVDTGPGGVASVGSLGLFASGSTTCSPQPDCAANEEFLGGEFTLPSAATLDGVQGWMSTSAGSMDVHIRLPDGPGGTPGTDVHSQNYSVTLQGTFDWKVFDNFNVDLPAGTYWVTFEPVANGGIVASMQGGVAVPLSNYGFFSPPNANWGTFTTPALGFRISGTASAVTTPSQNITNLMLLIRGLGLQGGIATSANAKLQAALDGIAANNTALACSSLRDEINFVNAQAGNKIAASDAATIRTSVDAIRTQLGC